MPRDSFLHELDAFPELIRIVSAEKGIIPQLVEKDYWIMHCLYGLTQQGFDFELKGGTSLSKGFGVIQRFSEDIDIRINPPPEAELGFKVYEGKNHLKSAQVESRKKYYDWLAANIEIEGIVAVERDKAFDDPTEKFRGGGIRLLYDSHLGSASGIKDGILLEVGFDDVTPNIPTTISSWAYEQAIGKIDFLDNQASEIKCYHPGYTFVEKLQAVSTKFRQQQLNGKLPSNFLRHYYDLAQLLEHKDVQEFIGTDTYHERKRERFRKDDNQNIKENEAFLLSDPDTRQLYIEEFKKTASLYYNGQADFIDILGRIQAEIDKL